MCSETFPKESALVLHTKKHYYPFECSICARFSIGYRNINCKFYEFGMAFLVDVVSGMIKISTYALARKIKTEGEVLRHEATHVESTLRRTTTSPPTRNRDLVTLPPEKQPIVKNSLFDVQNPLLPQILDDAPKKALHENSAALVGITSPEVAISAKSVEKPKAEKIPKLSNHKKPFLPPGPPQKPANKKAVKKQTNMIDVKNSPKTQNGDRSGQDSPEKQTKLTNNARGSLPKSIILPAQLKVTSNKSKIIKTDFKTEDDERRRALIFRQAVEYDEVKKRCDQLEEEIAKLELEFGNNLEFVKNEIKLEPIDMEGNGGEEERAVMKEKDADLREDDEMQVDEKWEGGGERVPPGWKVSKGPTRKFQSPEGFVFETRFPINFIFAFMIQGLLFCLSELYFEIFCLAGRVRSSS